MALGGALADGTDGGVGGGVFPGSGLFGAVEGDEGDAAGGGALDWQDFAAAGEEMATVGRKCWGDLLRVFLESGGIGDVHFGDDVGGQRLGLLRVKGLGGGCADGGTGEEGEG